MKNINIIGHKNKKDFELTQQAIKKACQRISQFLKLEIPKCTVKLTYSRRELDKKIGYKTKAEIVALADLGQDEVIILAPSVYAEESIYPIDRFPSTICHELTHITVNTITKGKCIPLWLSEGLPFVVAEQTEPAQTFFIPEQGICKTLDSPRNWKQNIKSVGQNLAGLFVKFLVNSYSSARIIKLLKASEPNYQYEHFAKIFNKLYGKTITEIEEEFLNKINT